MKNRVHFNLQYAYTRSARVVLFDKFNISNKYACPSLKQIFVYVNLKNLENFDSSRVLASFFILRLLTKQRPYIVRLKLFQTFHERDYEISVHVNLLHKAAYNFIEILGGEVLPFLPKLNILRSYEIRGEDSVVGFTIHDVSFMRIVETHFIFFKWHDKIHVQIRLSSSTKAAVSGFLRLLKLI